MGLLGLLIDTLQQARNQLAHLQTQARQLLGAIDRAKNLDDHGLMAITSCAEANIAQEAANVGKALASLGKLIGLINLFLEIIGVPEKIPDFRDLAGTPLDDTVESIDEIVKALKVVRDAIPLP